MAPLEIPLGLCIVCGKPAVLKLNDSVTIGKVIGWMANPVEMVQNALPELSPDQRELLITGTHGDCWPPEPVD